MIRPLTGTKHYHNVSRNVKMEQKPLLENFKSYFGESPLNYVFEEESVFTRAQVNSA